MTRSRSLIPTYRKKKDRGIVTVRNPDGSRRDILLPGKHNSAESLKGYESVLAMLRTTGGEMPTVGKRPNSLSIAELVLQFVEEHVQKSYIDPHTKEPTTEQAAYRIALRPLVRLYGDSIASEFGPLELKIVRESMILGTWMRDDERERLAKHGRNVGCARKTTNRNCDRIKMLFRWASENKLVPAATYHGLTVVRGLRRGQCEARETEPVKPAEIETVEAVIRELPPITADVVSLLLLTGARCGEICKLKTPDIDRAGPVWFATLDKHKTAHHGHIRTICFGPQAQLILNRYLKANPDAFLFSPAEQDRLIAEQKRAARKTPVQPSQQRRKKQKPKHKPGDRFDHNVINNAIRRAAKRVNVERFHVHQLRHTAALKILREHGIEAARSVLGHKQINMTLFYAGVDLEKAKDTMRKIG